MNLTASLVQFSGHQSSKISHLHQGKRTNVKHNHKPISHMQTEIATYINTYRVSEPNMGQLEMINYNP